MKRIIITLSLLFACFALHGQQVFTVLYAASDDGFVNVRKEANPNAKILAKIYEPAYGLGNGILLRDGNPWVKVKVGNVVGYANKKYLGMITWFNNTGGPRIVSYQDTTDILGEDYSGEGNMPVFTTIGKGIIIADTYVDAGDYYMLETAHDNLYIAKSDVIVVR